MALFNRPQTKFKHMQGKHMKNDQFYTNIRISKSTWDGTFCAVNPKFIAVITEAGSGAAFIVLPIDKTGRVDINIPTVCGHSGKVLDVKWNPFNDNVIASCSEDLTVKVWMIDDNGLDDNMTSPLVDLPAHQRKVTHILWHPVTENILLSIGQDKVLFIWDIAKAQPLVMVDDVYGDIIQSVDFNYNGSLFLTTCKDGYLRIQNSRTGDIVEQWQAHPKNTMAMFLKDGKVFTTGATKMSERKVAIWDPSDPKKKPFEIMDLDSGGGVLFPFYDCDTNLIYIWGKGDGKVSYYQAYDGPPYLYFLGHFDSNVSVRGITFMPKRGLDITRNEMARMFRLVDNRGNGTCEVISFTVPRVSEIFQKDLFDQTRGTEPQLTVQEWFEQGKDADPGQISLKDLYDEQAGVADDVKSGGTSNYIKALKAKSSTMSAASAALARSSASSKPETKKVPSASSSPSVSEPGTPPPEPNKRRTPPPPSATAAVDSAETAALKEELEETKAELKQTKQTVKTLKKEVKNMDTRLKMLESSVSILQQSMKTDTDDDGVEEAVV